MDIDQKELLSQLSFGKVDSESEDALDKIFIQTNDFNTFLDPQTSVILGAKGAGKSALFRLFTTFESSARAIARHQLNNVILIPATGFKDIPNMDYAEVYTGMKEANFDFQSAWQIYFAYKLVYGLYDKEYIISGRNSNSLLKWSDKLADKRFLGIIKKIYSRIIGDVPKIEQLSFKDVSIKLSQNHKISALDTLKEINEKLVEENKTVWILIDKIDELFSDRNQVRKKCIEGLFLTLIDFLSRFSNIKLKIFLRTDIWENINFVNQSHLADKKITLNWDIDSLSRLLVKRACIKPLIRNFVSEHSKVTDIEQDYERSFYTLFEKQAYSGTREASTLKYMMDRATDGQGGIYPRELITFCNYAKNIEFENTEDGVFKTPLISGLSVRTAFPQVSKTKVTTFLSEFEWLSQHFKRFEGKNQASFTKEELIDMMDGLEPNGDDMIRQLYETGVICPNLSTVAAASSFEVPRLFRIGLGIIMPGRP